jgi:hypothetical protein
MRGGHSEAGKVDVGPYLREKDILESVERGDWPRIPDFDKEAKRYQGCARATLRKDKRVNIGMTERDIVRFGILIPVYSVLSVDGDFHIAGCRENLDSKIKRNRARVNPRRFGWVLMDLAMACGILHAS